MNKATIPKMNRTDADFVGHVKLIQLIHYLLLASALVLWDLFILNVLATG